MAKGNTPEGKVKEKIDAIFAKHHAKVVNPATWGMGKSGGSDKLACVYGRFVAVEAKAGKNTPTALQREFLREVYAAGGIACVVNETNILAFDALCSQLASGRRLASVVIQPVGIDIFEEITSINPEDFEDE